MKTNYYIRYKGREVLRVNMVAVFMLLAAAVVALFLLTGCAYSVIPTADLDRAKDASGVIVDEGDKAGQREVDYKAQGKPEAAAEAGRLSQVGKYTQKNIQTPLGNSKTTAEIGHGFLDAGMAVAASSPWGAAIASVTSVLTVAAGAYAAIKRKQANESDEAHAYEEALIADPSIGGGTNKIDYGPKTRAKCLSDVAAGRLTKGAFKKMYRDG